MVLASMLLPPSRASRPITMPLCCSASVPCAATIWGVSHPHPCPHPHPHPCPHRPNQARNELSKNLTSGGEHFHVSVQGETDSVACTVLDCGTEPLGPWRSPACTPCTIRHKPCSMQHALRHCTGPWCKGVRAICFAITPSGMAGDGSYAASFTPLEAGGYVVTRPDGRVLCGSTMERVGFERGITFGGMADVIDTATRIAPALRSAAVEEHWSSFRPGTPDGLPLVGETRINGLFVASGHYRNGILLAPATAGLLADRIESGLTPPVLQPFAPGARMRQNTTHEG